MKPRVPIEKWVPPPDPVDGLLDVPARPKPAVLVADRQSDPNPMPPRTTPRPTVRTASDANGQDVTARQAKASSAGERVHVTLYLEPEDMERLRTEQFRRQQELRRPKRGVTDASAVVRDLIRKHLR
jgi:hypothetical protein